MLLQLLGRRAGDYSSLAADTPRLPLPIDHDALGPSHQSRPYKVGGPRNCIADLSSWREFLHAIDPVR